MPRSLALWAVLFCTAAPVLASPASDALAALQNANAQVSAASAINGQPSSYDQVRGALGSLDPAAFQALANSLSGLAIPQADQIRSVSLDLSAKVTTAKGSTSLVQLQALVEACRGIAGDVQSWQQLYGPLLTALSQQVNQADQGGALAQAVATLIPTQTGWTPPVPTPAPPTPTPGVQGQFIPTAVPVATPVGLPPLANGGLIPGGYVPQPPTPTPYPTATNGDDDRRLTPQPSHAAKAPLPIAAGHNGQVVWVANVLAGSVAVMDARTQRFTDSLPVGSNPSSLALDDGDNTLVVANAGSASVTLIDARGVRVIKTLGVGASPAQVLVTHAGKAYVACQDGHSVAVIDVARQVLLKNISLSSRPGRMDQPNSGGDVYVSLPDEDSVAVIDTGIDDVLAVVKE